MQENKATKPCPFCRETIYANALVCRFCSNDQPQAWSRQRNCPSWFPLAIASAILVGSAALLVHELEQERRCWRDDPARQPSGRHPSDLLDDQ